MMFDAVLIGLGKIGFGVGEYSRPWNSHLGSLIAAEWIQNIFVCDPGNREAEAESVARSVKVKHFSKEALVASNNQAILIDATPPDDRISRVKEFSEHAPFRLVFCEKPFRHTENFDYDAYPWSVTKINYPRASFKSTATILKKCASKESMLKFRFNNGTENAVPHFLNLVTEIGFDLREVETHTKGKKTVAAGNIELELAVGARNIFEFTMRSNDSVLEYYDFGRRIILNGREQLLDEIDARFTNIYGSFESLSRMPTLKDDLWISLLTQKIKGHLGDGI